jgi:hypothetical protein
MHLDLSTPTTFQPRRAVIPSRRRSFLADHQLTVHLVAALLITAALIATTILLTTT